MANVRQVRDRIKSVKNIQQITRAMKMVASARLRKAQTQLMEARPYSTKIKEMVVNSAGRSGDDNHPLLQGNPKAPAGLVVMTADKGLCAGFNVQTLQAVGRKLAVLEKPGDAEVLALGRKSVDFFRRSGIKPFKEWAGFWQELSWHHADAMGQELIDLYSAGRWSSLTFVFNGFKSMMTQEVTEKIILPLPKPEPAENEGQRLREYMFEPGEAEIFKYMLPRYVKISLWRAMLESKAAELAARMQAMDSATQSASEMIDDLTLQMNRARQAMITNEISELVGSAEAINA
ncbi:ATP synthase F1 subunit gamma [bacterium]|nr:ATP synthase F1 subunit gamma [bacterium]